MNSMHVGFAFALVSVALTGAVVRADNSSYGYCSIVYPGSPDQRGGTCSEPMPFGVAYNGYFFSESPCYGSASDAISAMQNEPACTEASTYGDCSIVYPGSQDLQGSTCGDPMPFGVAYNGYFFSNSPCYGSASDAISAMQNNAACQ